MVFYQREWWRIFQEDLGREATDDELELAATYEERGCSPISAVSAVLYAKEGK